MQHILVLDDDPAVRDVLWKVLAFAGHAVTEARDTTDGLELMSRRPIDTVFVDFFVSGDGLEFLQQVRQGFPHVNLVAMAEVSLARMTELLRGARLLGTVRRLPKPFRPEDALTVLY